MICKRIEKRLLEDEQAFLDRDVREHLANCAACSRLYEELEEIEELYRDLARRERAPGNFTGQVIEQISTNSRLKIPFVAGGLLLLAVAVVAGLGDPAESRRGAPQAERMAPSGPAVAFPLLDQSQPVEFDLHYPRVQLYVIEPSENLAPEKSFPIEILPADGAQTDYLKYVSH